MSIASAPSLLSVPDDTDERATRQKRQIGRAGRADIRGVNTLSGYVRRESVSAEFSTTASEPWLRLHVTVEE